jgi:Na+/phosphate symporter
MSDPALPVAPVSWKPTAKMIAAGLTAVVTSIGAFIALYSTGTLSLKTAVPAVIGPWLPVIGGYLKSS